MNQASLPARADIRDHNRLMACGTAWRIRRNSRKRQLGFGGFRRPVGWLNTALAWLPGDIVAGVTLAAYAIPGFACLRWPCRLAAAGRHLRLSAGRSGLCPARILASARDRADFRHLADDCRDRGGNGRGGRATLRPDRQPRGLHGRGALPVRLAVAAERARKADQRQHSCGFQGRRRLDDCDDAAAEPVRRERRGPQFFRTGVRCWPGNSVRCSTSFSSSGSSRSGCIVFGERLLPGKPVALGVVTLAIIAATLLGLPALGVPITGEIPAGLPSLGRPGSQAARRRGNRSVGRRLPAAGLYRGRICRPHLRGEAWICSRSPAGASWASVRPISQRRWDTAIRSPADCRNRR